MIKISLQVYHAVVLLHIDSDSDENDGDGDDDVGVGGDNDMDDDVGDKMVIMVPVMVWWC